MPLNNPSAINPDDNAFHDAAYSTSMPTPTISSPAADATGVSTTPTIVTVEGISKLYSLYTRSTTDQVSVGVNTDLIYNFSTDADIPLDTGTGVFTLPSGYEFELTASPNLTSFSASTAYAYFDWVLASDNSTLPNGQSGSIIPSTFTSNSGSQPQAKAVIRTTEATQVKVRTTAGSGTSTFSQNNSWATIQATTSKYIDYTHIAIQVQVRVKSTGVVVYDSGDVTVSLQITVSPALSATTEYETRTRHKNEEGSYTRWSNWQTFTTA